MAREIVETWDIRKIDWSAWHCVRLDLSSTSGEYDKGIWDWLDHDVNARGKWTAGNGAWDFWFSDADTALAFKLRFG